MSADFIGPTAFFLIGTAFAAAGILRWSGVSRSWYVRPGRREHSLQMLIGRSPLVFVFLSIPFFLADVGVVSIYMRQQIAVVLAAAMIISILMAVFLMIARPRWS